MPTLIVTCSLSLSPTIPLIIKSQSPPPFLSLPSIKFSRQAGRRKYGGTSVLTRAAPGMNTYIVAFVFPMTLLAVTVFSAIRVADKLDEKFLEEMAQNEALMEAEEYDDDDDDDDDDEQQGEEEEEENSVPVISLREGPTVPRVRDRPKREAEPSSM